jgi:hypothetical protein
MPLVNAHVLLYVYIVRLIYAAATFFFIETTEAIIEMAGRGYSVVVVASTSSHMSLEL